MKRIFIVGVAALAFAGCGPRPLTHQEKVAKAAEARANAQAAKAQEEAANKRSAEAKERAAKAKLAAAKAKAKANAIEAQAKHQARVAIYRKWQLAKQPLPKGVAQVSAEDFIVDKAHMVNARYLCSGPEIAADNSHISQTDDINVDSVRNFDGSHMIITCDEPQRKFRDAGFKP